VSRASRAAGSLSEYAGAWLNEKQAIPGAVLVTACAALLAFLVFSGFNMVFEIPYMSILFWVWLGLGAAALPPENTA